MINMINDLHSVLQTKDKKLYSTCRVEIFDSNEWLWSPLPDLVKLPFCVSLTNPQPITTRGSIYMLLTNGEILRVDAYSATWEILTSPAPTLECDQARTSKQLVKYSGKLGFAFKPPNGRWEIWVLNIDHSWEKVLVFTVNQDIGNKPIKAGLYDTDIRAMVDRGTIISSMFKGGETDHSSQIFSFRSDLEPIDLTVG
ncbi:F-box associated domain containing protein [Tanacetum coccineum]